ncbi:biotin/lipoyl-binding protein [Lacipirellula sp.]|uniref:biotin/lipoyl-binding protein n=1 Tax=Lacipirellula sp. TaxID=2691419 RepID=UPI003D0F5DA1
MPTLADSIVSSSSRKLTIRARPDLKFRKQRYQGRTYWVVKDPVGLQYFRFEEEEFAILQMLDGKSSLDDIAQQFEAEFPPQTIRVEELQNFIGMLHKSGLVLSDATGQGWALKERRDEKKRRELLGALSNVMAFRMRGIDPERLLNWLYPYVRWFFTPAATIGALMLAAAALSLVIVQFDIFKSRLPDFNSFFSAQNWLALAITLTATKILHEFGHGMSCKHFGGECHEMGVMFLVMTPCLYCNVSDSWMLPNRWHRAAIGAAGMYVEVCLASICTFIWWFSQPGPLNYFCLNVMFVSSVSTIMFNANPLLRYDGYYILSDILEIPNLRQKASTILNRKLGKWCLGLEEQEDPFLPKRHQALFALYTIASALYRWVVLFSILFFLNKVFEPYGLKVLGQALAIASIYGMFVMPAMAVWKFFRVPGRWSKVKRVRLYITLSLLAGIVASLFLVPLPMHVMSPFELQPYDAENVYVEVPGRLVKIGVKSGQHVKKGDLIAQLENLDLEMEIARLQGERAALETEIENLDSLLYQPSKADKAAGDYDTARKKLDGVIRELAQKETDLTRLTIVAPRDGVVIPPLRTLQRPRTDAAELPQWTGTPLDERNIGSSLSPQGQQNLICMIGDPNEWEAVMIVDQDDSDLVKDGQEVQLMFEESAYHVFKTQISSISGEHVTAAPTRLASTNGGSLAAQQNPDGSISPLNTSFQVTARLNNAQDLLNNGLTGAARIDVAPKTVIQRVWRYLSRTFNFEL